MSREKQSSDGAHGFTIVLLDWGLAKRLPESKRAGFCEMTYAAATFDFGLMMDAFKTLGLKLKRENVAEDMVSITRIKTYAFFTSRLKRTYNLHIHLISIV